MIKELQQNNKQQIDRFGRFEFTKKDREVLEVLNKVMEKTLRDYEVFNISGRPNFPGISIESFWVDKIKNNKNVDGYVAGICHTQNPFFEVDERYDLRTRLGIAIHEASHFLGKRDMHTVLGDMNTISFNTRNFGLVEVEKDGQDASWWGINEAVVELLTIIILTNNQQDVKTIDGEEKPVSYFKEIKVLEFVMEKMVKNRVENTGIHNTNLDTLRKDIFKDFVQAHFFKDPKQLFIEIKQAIGHDNFQAVKNMHTKKHDRKAQDVLVFISTDDEKEKFKHAIPALGEKDGYEYMRRYILKQSNAIISMNSINSKSIDANEVHILISTINKFLIDSRAVIAREINKKLGDNFDPNVKIYKNMLENSGILHMWNSKQRLFAHISKELEYEHFIDRKITKESDLVDIQRLYIKILILRERVSELIIKKKELNKMITGY